MMENKTLIVLNPDRIARQIFPPFRFLLEALVKKDIKVNCLSRYEFSLPCDSGGYDILKFDRNGKTRSLSSFVLKSVQETFMLCFFNKIDGIIVFRCSDCLWHAFSSFVSKVPITFFVDYLPWPYALNEKIGWRDYLHNPKVLFRVLGFYFADTIVFSSESLKKQVCSSIHFLGSKSLITVKYSSDLFGQCVSGGRAARRKEILNSFAEIEKPFIIASTAGYQSSNDIEICLRALSALEDEDTVLALHTDRADLNYFYSLISGLGLQNRVTIFGSNYSFFDIIASADLLVLPTVGAGVGGYALNALNQEIPVVAGNRGDLFEWIGSEKLLFEKDNTGNLISLIEGFKRKDPALLDEFKKACEYGKGFNQSWEENALASIFKLD